MPSISQRKVDPYCTTSIYKYMLMRIMNCAKVQNNTLSAVDVCVCVWRMWRVWSWSVDGRTRCHRASVG